MDASLYWLGVFFAILSGILNNFGTVLQKKVVNDHREDEEFLKNLVKNPLWLTGLIIGMGVGTVFFMISQVFIGPALIPGLMASGLIVLAIGSVYIVGESLKGTEIFGIILMIIGIAFLGFSELSIDIIETDMEEIGFVIRVALFTFFLFLSTIVCNIIANKIERLRGIALALVSGFLLSISNFWIAPLMAVIAKVFEGTASWGELIWFLCGAVLLPTTNIYALTKLQKAFKEGQASNLIPIQQVPMQIAPIVVYFFVFLLIAPTLFSVLFLILGVSFIVISSFLLGRRQAQMEEIQK